MRFLPWFLAAGFAASTLVLSLRGPASASQPTPSRKEATVEAAAPSHPAAIDLAALRRCSARLEAAQLLIARVEGAASAANAPAPGAGLPACAGNAAALAEVEARISEEVERRLEEIATRRLTVRDEHRVAMRNMVKDYLGLSDDESGWLMDYVCSVRGLRADVIDDIRDAKIDLKSAAERQKVEREEALHDIERILGPDKYQQLRSVGGLGKLGDLFECV